MTTLSIESVNLTLNGLTLERGMMDQPPPPLLTDQNFEQLPSDLVTELADRIAARLLDKSPSPVPSAAPDTAQATRGHWSTTPAPASQSDTVSETETPPDTQTPQPDAAEPSASGSESAPAVAIDGPEITLRHCFDRLRPRRTWSTCTANAYRCLVESWERWHIERGTAQPDIRSIADGDFWQFAQWRGWDELSPTLATHWTYFSTLLKCHMAKAPGNRDGLHPDKAVLRYLPDSGVPAKPELTRDMQRDMEQKRRRKSRRLSVDDMHRMMLAARSTDWPQSTGSEASESDCLTLILALLWYFGITRDDLLLIEVDAFDFNDNTLTYIRQKTKRHTNTCLVGPLPLPDVLLPLAERVVASARTAGSDQLFRITPAQCRSATGMIYPHIEAIYREANVEPLPHCSGVGWFHSWRKTAVTLWKRIAPQWQEYITGHSPKSVSDQSYDGPCDSIRPLINNDYATPAALIELSQR